MNRKIDFVIAWVDGNDQEWQAEKRKYEVNINSNADNSEYRFRDWDNLQYWFRGVERYAPWVHKIYFVTWGHVPAWLDVNHPKLEIVKHTDYIPKEYLPTFSSHVIELNFHRIKGLSEQFVYFNDDTFIISPLVQEDFFVDNKPCDSAILNVHCYDFEKIGVLAPFIDIGIINKHFDMKEVIRANKSKWYNLKYGKYVLRNAILQSCPRFPGMLQQHLPNAFLKKTYDEVWDKEREILEQTCKNRFRYALDVNQWLFREWQLASGNFIPRKVNVGKSMYAEEYERVVDYITNNRGKFICINDSNLTDEEYKRTKQIINNCFEKVFPEVSSFEK